MVPLSDRRASSIALPPRPPLWRLALRLRVPLPPLGVSSPRASARGCRRWPGAQTPPFRRCPLGRSRTTTTTTR
eukprot:5440683-Alexandrium_andersonii.AAC.1